MDTDVPLGHVTQEGGELTIEHLLCAGIMLRALSHICLWDRGQESNEDRPRDSRHQLVTRLRPTVSVAEQGSWFTSMGTVLNSCQESP